MKNLTIPTPPRMMGLTFSDGFFVAFIIIEELIASTNRFSFCSFPPAGVTCRRIKGIRQKMELMHHLHARSGNASSATFAREDYRPECGP